MPKSTFRTNSIAHARRFRHIKDPPSTPGPMAEAAVIADVTPIQPGLNSDHDTWESEVEEMGAVFEDMVGEESNKALEAEMTRRTGGHLYRHDLESLFFVMLCLACRYAAPGVPAPEPRPYPDWYTGTNRNFTKKNSFKKRYGRVNIELEDFNFDYDWTTLGKFASYTQMRSIMSLFNGGSLVTRWAGWNPEH
ncbi:hypothetical protein F5050DRAFT_1905411 [Lentinula boryana]|uniref:Uncharacterized protein n=1 Tax=Lentinula boryana TaxID=40481 RepID=A0ABQ8Q147_9AGAR|nr:hypothetical protein F5050DRAFT_1905411 [Lentinula boryana]